MSTLTHRVSSRLRKPHQDDVPYTTQALRQDLLRVQNAWDECQAHRERDAIYSYLTAVFDLVMWWARKIAASRALARRYGCRISGRPITTNRFDGDLLHRRSSKWTSEHAPSSRARCGTRWSTNRILSRLPRSFSGRAASTNVLRGLRVAVEGTWRLIDLSCSRMGRPP
jgi:hypothetical protein